jgi:hypothetical protein
MRCVRPTMLHPAHLRIDDTTLSAGLSELVQTRSGAVLQMRKLLELAGLALPDAGKITPAAGEQLATALDRIGFALEPDYRYDGWLPGLDDEVVIFKAEDGGPISPERPAYLETKIKIDAIALSAANRNAPGEGFESVKEEIATAAGFSPVERARLLAYAFVSLASPPELKREERVGHTKSTNSGSRSNKFASLEMKFFPLAGASVLLGFAIFLAYFAARIDPTPSLLKMSAADMRHECSLITDPAFQTECFQHAQHADGGGARIVAAAPKALPTIQ